MLGILITIGEGGAGGSLIQRDRKRATMESRCVRRIEFGDQVPEGCFEVRTVLLRMARTNSLTLR
jgi:hypothetical protein